MIHKLILCLLLAFLITGCGLSKEQINQRDGYLLRAQVYYQNKKYLNALHQLELALELDSEFKKAISYQAWSFFYLKKYEEAEESFKEVLEIDDSDSWMHFGLASVYFEKGNLFNRKIRRLKTGEKQAGGSQKDLLKKKESKDVEATIAKHRKEANLWYEKSLEHYETAYRYQQDIENLHDMIAAANIMLGLPFYDAVVKQMQKKNINKKDFEASMDTFMKKGFPHYKTAIVSFDKHIKTIDDQYKAINELIQKVSQKRSKTGLNPKNHEKYDQQIEYFEKQKSNNRIQYRIAQGMVGQHCFELARLMGYARDQISKGQYRSLTQQYVQESKKRVNLILKTSPNTKSAYPNLAKIAELENDYKSAKKYLEEYLRRYPVADPRDLVSIREALKNLLLLELKKNSPEFYKKYVLEISSTVTRKQLKLVENKIRVNKEFPKLFPKYEEEILVHVKTNKDLHVVEEKMRLHSLFPEYVKRYEKDMKKVRNKKELALVEKKIMKDVKGRK